METPGPPRVRGTGALRHAPGPRGRTWSGPLSNILRVRGNWWECGVYCVPAAPGRPGGGSRLAGCLATSLVRLELLALDVGGEPLSRERRVRFTRSPASATER